MILLRTSRKVGRRYFPILAVFCCAIVICGCGVSKSSQSQTSGQGPTAPTVETVTVNQKPLSGKENPNCPATVWLLKTGPSKPPFTFYHFKIQLRNRQSGPSWLVLRYDDELPNTGRFECYEKENYCISATQLAEGASKHEPKVVVIRFLGRQTFTAIRMPEGGDITLGEYVMTTNQPVPDFEIWEVDSILVNGKTPLEQWLPYPVMSDRLVRINVHAKQTLLDGDAKLNTNRQNDPAEKVEFVTARAIRKWLAPIASSERKTP